MQCEDKISSPIPDENLNTVQLFWLRRILHHHKSQQKGNHIRPEKYVRQYHIPHLQNIQTLGSSCSCNKQLTHFKILYFTSKQSENKFTDLKLKHFYLYTGFVTKIVQYFHSPISNSLKLHVLILDPQPFFRMRTVSK